MDKGHILVELCIFYGVIALLLGGIGESMKTDAHIMQISTGQDGNYTTTVEFDTKSYDWLIGDMASNMGIDDFTLGEFGLSDECNIKNVYVSTKSYDKQHIHVMDSIPDYIYGILGLGKNVDLMNNHLTWKHGTRLNLSEGDQIYLYPYIRANMGGLDVSRYIIAQVWDVNGNEWISGMEKWETWIGGTIEVIFRMDCGLMPNTDLYYCVDVIKSDIDIGDYFDIQGLIDIGKAEWIERYGGVIRGEITQTQPQYMTPHEIEYKPIGAWNSFLTLIGNVVIGFKAFQGFGIVTIIIDTLLFVPLAVRVGHMLYDEGKSFIPFIRGD